mgnify:CR=1 FL=1
MLLIVAFTINVYFPAVAFAVPVSLSVPLPEPLHLSTKIFPRFKTIVAEMVSDVLFPMMSAKQFALVSSNTISDVILVVRCADADAGMASKIVNRMAKQIDAFLMTHSSFLT